MVKRILIVALLLFNCIACTGKDTDDRLVLVKKDDPQMTAAIGSARRTLPEFWKSLQAPAADESEFYVKLAISDGTDTEHFWIGRIRQENGKLMGSVSNYPELVKGIRFGQKVEIDERLISDWKFMKAGRMKGGYTIAVLLTRISKEEADEIKRQTGWK